MLYAAMHHHVSTSKIEGLSRLGNLEIRSRSRESTLPLSRVKAPSSCTLGVVKRCTVEVHGVASGNLDK